MQKWMLVSCCDREIDIPLFFDTYKEAYDAMCKDFAQIVGVDASELIDITKSEIADMHDVGILPDAAWAEKRGSKYDWKIFDVRSV